MTVNIYEESYIDDNVYAIADLPVPVPASRTIYLNPLFIASIISDTVSSWSGLGFLKGKCPLASGFTFE